MDAHDFVAEAKILEETIWKTRGSRLEAYRRLRSMARWSTAAVTTASVYVIGISVVQVTFELSPTQDGYLTVGLIVSAVAILAMSLYEAGTALELQAERFHRSGQQLRPLVSRARRLPGLSREIGASNLLELEAEYDRLVAELAENHEPRDHDRFRARYSKDFPMKGHERWYIVSTWWLRFHWRYVAMIAIPPALLYALLR